MIPTWQWPSLDVSLKRGGGSFTIGSGNPAYLTVSSVVNGLDVELGSRIVEPKIWQTLENQVLRCRREWFYIYSFKFWILTLKKSNDGPVAFDFKCFRAGEFRADTAVSRILFRYVLLANIPLKEYCKRFYLNYQAGVLITVRKEVYAVKKVIHTFPGCQPQFPEGRSPYDPTHTYFTSSKRFHGSSHPTATILFFYLKSAVNLVLKSTLQTSHAATPHLLTGTAWSWTFDTVHSIGLIQKPRLSVRSPSEEDHWHEHP